MSSTFCSPLETFLWLTEFRYLRGCFQVCPYSFGRKVEKWREKEYTGLLFEITSKTGFYHSSYCSLSQWQYLSKWLVSFATFQLPQILLLTFLNLFPKVWLKFQSYLWDFGLPKPGESPLLPAQRLIDIGEGYCSWETMCVYVWVCGCVCVCVSRSIVSNSLQPHGQAPLTIYYYYY